MSLLMWLKVQIYFENCHAREVEALYSQVQAYDNVPAKKRHNIFLDLHLRFCDP